MKTEIYQSEGYQFMGAAFEVYNSQGYGMAEEIYQECLVIELGLQRIEFKSKPELVCHYKGTKLMKRYVPDMIVFNSLVVELKAVTQLTTEHEAQLLNICESRGSLWATSSILATRTILSGNE